MMDLDIDGSSYAKDASPAGVLLRAVDYDGDAVMLGRAQVVDLRDWLSDWLEVHPKAGGS